MQNDSESQLYQIALPDQFQLLLKDYIKPLLEKHGFKASPNSKIYRRTYGEIKQEIQSYAKGNYQNDPCYAFTFEISISQKNKAFWTLNRQSGEITDNCGHFSHVVFGARSTAVTGHDDRFRVYLSGRSGYRQGSLVLSGAQ